ncbi:MAG: CPBP family intramembrane metalloprotease [Clostridia bacterium]|nr:CPBP family intramembrane metalloprotease [Clostridia bacterium]
MENNYQNTNTITNYGNPLHQNVKLYPAEYFEKKAEKKILSCRANWMGAELLLVQVFGIFASIIALIVLAFMGWGNGEGGVHEDALEYIFYSPISLLIPAIIIAWCSKQKITELIPFKKTSFSTALGLFLFGFLSLAIGGMLSDIVAFVLPTSSAILEISQSPNPTSYSEWIALILYSAAIPALVEEFVFRGVMLNSLRRYGDAIAIWFSAIMFALVHGNFLQIAVTLPAGLFLGFITVCSGNIWVAVALHFANNFIACITGELYSLLSPIITSVIGEVSSDIMGIIFSGIIYAIYIIFGIVGAIILKAKFKKDENFGTASNGTVTCLTNKEKIKGLYFAPTVIIAIIFQLGQSILLLFPPVIEFLKQ